MSFNDRVKRPPLERMQAIRNWSTLFKGPGTDGGTPAPGDSDQASLNDVVTRSVDLGYRVVDEYIRQGQKAAQRLNDRSYGAQTMAGDAQDLAMRMTQYASDFAAVWLQLVQLAAAGNPSPPAPKAGGGGERATPEAVAATADTTTGLSPHSEAREEAIRVRIEMRSAQPAEVAVDLRPDAARQPLIVHALRAVDAEKPRLTEVSFEPGSDLGAACLRIRVPVGHPPGIYSGLMIDEATSRPVGSVSVTIGD
jgi:hypothetical protein